MIHQLKCATVAFQAKWSGKKDWEFRKNDRDYQEGDILKEMEYDIETKQYSGKEIMEKVVWIIHGGSFGIPEGYVIMSTKIITNTEL